MKQVEINDGDAAVVLSPDSVYMYLPDLRELGTDIGDGKMALDSDNEVHAHVMIAWAIMSLLVHDDEFPKYVLARVEELGDKILPMEIEVDEDDDEKP